MKRQGFHQQPNQSQSEVHPSHGWMQSATVREIPKQEEASAPPIPQDWDTSWAKNLVNIPVGDGKRQPVQAKLIIGQRNDHFEQEADSVARKTVNWINSPRDTVQRLEEEEMPENVEEDEEVQLKPLVQRQEAMGEGEGSKQVSNRTGLPNNLKAGIENLSGYSMDDVRVHYNSPKPPQLQALAYTQGTDIHVAPGQEKHLPHEAWHVVQQKQGRVKPTVQMKGVEINDDKGLEREADLMGAKVSYEKDNLPEALTNGTQTQKTPNRLVTQFKFDERHKNNNEPTRKAMRKHRIKNQKWNFTGCQKNFAINMDDTSVYGISDSGGHAERNLLAKMSVKGRVAGSAINIHTERETCESCYTYLENLHDEEQNTGTPFDMNISYTVEYPDDGNSQQELYNYYKNNSDIR